MSVSGAAKKQWIGIAVSFVLLAGLAVMIDWNALGKELRNLNYYVLLPVCVVYVAHLVMRAWRWRYLLPGDPLGLRLLFDASMVGHLATYILPARAGEFIRPFMLSRWSAVGFPAAFVSVVTERFFDLAAVLISFAVIVPLVPGMPDWVFSGAWALFVLALLIFCGIACGALFPALLRGMCAPIIRRLPGGLARFASHILDEFLTGAGVLREPRRLLATIAWTLLVWISNYLMYYMFLWMVNIEPTVLFSVGIAVILAFAVAAPSSPGFLGVYQVGCVAAFLLFGHSEEKGLAYAIVTHAFSYIVILGGGAWVLSTHGLRFADLRTARGKAQHDVEELEAQATPDTASSEDLKP